jgi:dTDP-4-amino-4,6-dideoxygalactose transaminase
VILTSKHLALDEDELLKKITPNTGAILLTHILGYNGLTTKIFNASKENKFRQDDLRI